MTEFYFTPINAHLRHESMPFILSLYFSLQNMTLSSSLKAWLGSNQPLTSLHALGTQQHNKNIGNI
jgi:hypothetical protein